MQPTETAARARTFKALHHADKILVLPNCWDVITGRIFEEQGFPAIATTSFGIARAHGIKDGLNAALEPCLAMAARIAEALIVPLTVDIEAAYAETPEQTAKNAARFAEAGAAGVNIEDGQEIPGKPLIDMTLAAEKVRAFREGAAKAGVPVFINARTDVFWLNVGEPGSKRIDEVLRRAEAYAKAGADGIFVPGLVAPDDIRRVVASINLPLNVLGGPKTPPAAELQAMGVKRVSVGSGPMRAALKTLQAIGEELRDKGTWGYAATAIAYDKANAL